MNFISILTVLRVIGNMLNLSFIKTSAEIEISMKSLVIEALKSNWFSPFFRCFYRERSISD